ncbi:MAG: putative hydrolase of the superfamily [Microbacteriaceae bacterium]|nr:putative hydrolase of the superfamily [Microbacteriaceae bacterium]
MAIAIPGRVVVFDYGEVISVSPSDADRRVLEQIADVPADRFWAAYQADRDGLDGGELSTHDYWARIGRACGQRWDDARIQALWCADIRAWVSADPGVVTLIEELHAGGTRLALLSNAAADYGGLLRFSPVSRCFEQVFLSGELRLLKPEEAIYRHVADHLGIPLARMVFIDNRRLNVEGAESLGVTGHVFTGTDPLRAFLTDLAETEQA